MGILQLDRKKNGKELERIHSGNSKVFEWVKTGIIQFLVD